VYFWVWYWIYHITFICDLGLHVERPAVDICWRRLAGCFPFADWILLLCWIVVSWTFVPHLSIFSFHKYKVRQEISFQNGLFSFLPLKTTVIYTHVLYYKIFKLGRTYLPFMTRVSHYKPLPSFATF
jgi:hypothetical protein